MSRRTRIVLLVYAGLVGLLAFGFAVQSELATQLWPWPDGRLSYIFIGSILAAISATFVAWAITDEPAGGQAIILNTIIITVVGTVHFLRMHERLDEDKALVAAGVFALAALAFIGMAAWSFRFKFRDRIRTPRLVRYSFLLFVVALVVVGLRLITTAENTFPWPLKPESSVMFGWVFIGAAAYFLHGFLVPYRNNARTQLAGFLAYDVVLIVPFLRHFADVSSDQRLSLIVYTVVVAFSGVLSAYYLFVDPRMRLVAPRKDGVQPAPATPGSS